LSTLLVSATLLVTIVAALVFGILAGYVAVIGLLHAFAQSRERSHPPARALAASVGSGASSGD
jgi:hypothetical protein